MHTSASVLPGSEGRRGGMPRACHQHDTSPLRISHSPGTLGAGPTNPGLARLFPPLAGERQSIRLWGLCVGSNTVHLLGVGGSLEVGAGVDEEPDAVASLPLGAGRLSRDWISTDPPSSQEVRRIRKHVRAEIARETGGMLRQGPPDQVVGTSKTFRQLARTAG